METNDDGASEQVVVNRIVAQAAAEMRHRLLAALQREKARHWRKSGRLQGQGVHFERGFSRGIRHAQRLVALSLDAAKIRVMIRG
jgi:hypothetical protein